VAVKYGLPYPTEFAFINADLESCVECAWVEILNLGGRNLLIGNYVLLSPTLNLKLLLTTFVFQKDLETHNFCLSMVGDFNPLGFDWCLCQILINTLNLKAMWFTLLRVLLTLTSALKLSAAAIIFF
jgi:hypothetical protein